MPRFTDLISSFLRDARIEMTCDTACSFCSHLSEEESIERGWEIFLQHARQAECTAAKRTQALTHGSLVSIRDICFRCQTSVNTVQCAYEEMSVENINGVVNIDPLGVCTSRVRCALHHSRKLKIHCFGDVPQYSVVKTSVALNSENRFLPLRFYRRTNEERFPVGYVDDPACTFLDSFIYVANPCYSESWAGGVTTRVWEHEDLENNLTILVRADGYEKDQRMWTLKEVSESKPFITPSGPFKIASAMCVRGRRWDFHDLILFPPQKDKQSERADGAEGLVVRRNRRRRVTYSVNEVLGAAAEEENNENPGRDGFGEETGNGGYGRASRDEVDVGHEVENEEGTDAQEEGERARIAALNNSHPVSLQGNIPIPLTDTESPPDFLGKKLTSKIPFLFASLPYLLEIRYRNHHYDETERVGRVSLVEARRTLQRANTGIFVSGLRSSELLRMGLSKDAIDKPEFSSLKLFCDVDSMDVVTHPWGGMVFRGGLMKIYSQFKGGTGTKDAISQLNDKNDLTLLKPCDEFTYPGIYFVYMKGGRKQHIPRTEEDLDPIGLKMFEMKSNLCMENLIVRAIIPTWSISMASVGQGSLLKLFAKYLKDGGADNVYSENCGLSNRQLAERFFWYLIREMLFFSLSLFSRNVCYPISRDSLPCCAIPTETNGCRHDRQAGLGSNFRGGVVVESEEMMICFQILCRFFRALEDHAEVPVEQRSFPVTENDENRYEVGSELLDRIEDASLRECLQSDLGDIFCAEYFEDNVWNGMKVLNGILVLQSDESRRGRKALPDAESNAGCLSRGHMVLEDLLILAPVVFRMVRHGMKRSFHTSESGEAIKNLLAEEFSLDMIQDGVIDVAYNLEGPRNSGVAVVLPAWTVQKTKLLFPVEESSRSLRSLRGTVYTARGYPETLGLSTGRGRAGVPSTGLQEEGIRKLKAYSTNRSMESNRGQTVYDGAGNALKGAMRNISALIYEWKCLRGCRDSREKVKVKKREAQRMSFFETLLHDAERRELAVRDEDTFGVRIELTEAFKGGVESLDAAVHLLRMQEKKMEMTEMEFERCFVGHPEQWPWFLNIPNQDFRYHKARGLFDISLIPVTLVPCKDFIQFNATVEKELLMTAYAWYKLSRAWVAQHTLPDIDGRTEMYLHFLRELPHGKSISFGMLACRAFLSSANMFVHSISCMEEDISPQMPSFVESALGLDISYYESGIPQVITSRLIANGGPLKWVMDNRISGSGTLLTSLYESPRSVEQAAHDLDSELEIPDRLSFECRREAHGYSMQVMGPAFQKGITADMLQRRAFDDILHSIFFIPSKHEAKKTMWGMAAFVTALLVSDCTNELRKNFGISTNNHGLNSVLRREHSWRMKPQISVEDCEELGNMAEKGAGWQPEFRFDVCGVEEEEEELTFLARMNGLLSFYGGNTVGRTCLAELGGMEYGNELTDEMGRVNVDRFLQMLWRRCQIVQEEEHIETSEWKCILCLRSVGKLAVENGSAEVIHFEDEVMWTVPFKDMFEKDFPTMMRGCLESAGFMNLSPLLTPSYLGCEKRRIWSTTPIFSYLQDDGRALTAFRRLDEDDERANGGMMIFRRSFVSCLRFIMTYKMELEQVMEYERDEDLNEQRQVQLEMEQLSNLFWKREVVQELALMSLHEKRKDARFTSLSKESFDYCILVLECLINIRRELRDEGIAAVMGESGDMRSVKEGGGEPAAADEFVNTFPPVAEWFKRPWKSLNYPKSTITREGRVTKKVVVRQSSLLLFESGLVFKTVLPSRAARKGISHADIRNKSVGEIYAQYREVSARGVIGSHSMWRLVPDSVILRTLEQACQKGMRASNISSQERSQ